jgi:hypothetical protein
MLDTTTQTIASAGTPQVITFDTTIKADKIAVTSSSRFTVNEAGEYLINATASVTAGVANKIIDIWFRVNGTDVANSNSKRTIVNNEVKALPIGGQVVTLTAGQYVEFWMNGDDTSVSLVSYAAGTTPTRPVTPSILFTIQKIHP